MENRTIDAIGKRNGHAKRRCDAEQMKMLAPLLPPRDRHLVELVYGKGVSMAAVAGACGLKAQPLYNRIARIERLMGSPEVAYLVAVQEMIPPDAKVVVMEHLIGGKSVASLAAEHEWPVSWVYRTIRTYQKWAKDRSKKS